MSSKEIANKFYDAFVAKDYRTMQSLYAINAVFSDEVFKSLNGFEAGKMWEMLIKSGKDMKVEYKILDSDKNSAKVKWIAHYTFSKTGRKVKNEIVANLEFLDGKIISHRDKFSFGKWAKQALGFVPWLFSFMGVTQKKVRETAQISLNDYIRANP